MEEVQPQSIEKKSETTKQLKPAPDQKYKYKGPGRPTILSEEIVSKLEYCAAIRATITETCSYAGIARQTYYRWLEENSELSDRLDDLREKPFITARKTVIDNLSEVPTAFKFLEKVKPEEFADSLNLRHSGYVGGEVPEEDKAVVAEFHGRLKSNMKDRILKKSNENNQQTSASVGQDTGSGNETQPKDDSSDLRT